jgi:hypothetical protein
MNQHSHFGVACTVANNCDIARVVVYHGRSLGNVIHREQPFLGFSSSVALSAWWIVLMRGPVPHIMNVTYAPNAVAFESEHHVLFLV